MPAVDLRSAVSTGTRAWSRLPTPSLRGFTTTATIAFIRDRRVPIADRALSHTGTIAFLRSPRNVARTGTTARGRLKEIDRPYQRAFLQLLPPGKAWPRDEDTQLAALAEALTYEFGRVDAAAWKMLDEMIPNLSSDLLPDWEAALGTDVAPTNGDLRLRRLAVGLKFMLGVNGSFDEPFVRELARRLGYPFIEIREFRQFTCVSKCNDALSQGEWVFTWWVTTPHGPNDALFEWFLRQAQMLTTLLVIRYN